MKQYLKPANLPLLTVGAGVVGLLLRIWLLASGIDEKGLLQEGHPAEILLWLLSAAVIGLLFWQTQMLTSAPKYSFNYPASLPGAIGAVCGAAGFLVSSFRALAHGGDLLLMIASVLGILSSAAIAFVGFCRYKGQPVSVIFHGLACIYLMLQLICLYRQWCADPQLQDYCFQLLAVVCLALSLFHRSGFDAGMGQRRPLALSHLAAVYFCLLAIPGSGNTLFFAGSSLWMLTDLCNLTPMVRRRRPRSEGA